MIEFRPYQNLINSEIIDKFKYKDNLLCVASMGAGKSLIISEIARHYSSLNKNVVILINVSELINQLVDIFQVFNLNFNVIKSNHDFEKYNSNNNKIWLIMEQSFHEKKRLEYGINCDILIKDEFHIGFSGQRYNKILEYFKPNKILGLSGTPFDEKGYLLKSFTIDDLILHGEAKELTDLGYLVPLKYYTVSWSEKKDYSSIKMSGNDYSSKALDEIINTIEHNNLIIESMNNINAKNKKTLVYCNSIKQANQLNDLLIKEGYKSAVIHSKIKDNINSGIISQFGYDLNTKDGIDCLVSVSKLTTGFNQPKANLLVLCRPTKILRLYLQILFRVARTYPGKEFAEVLDLAQCVKTHGFGTEPREYITQGNIDALKKHKEQISKPFIKDILKTNSVEELKPDEVIIKMKELKLKSLEIPNEPLKNLIKMYSNTLNLDVVVNVLFELNFRSNKIKYKNDDVSIFLEELKIVYEQLKKDKQKRILQHIKDYLRNYIREKKSLFDFNFDTLYKEILNNG